MDENLNMRVQTLITMLGIKKIEFAKKLSISSPFVSELCSGAKAPSDRTIADICREFNVNEKWLRYGEGDVFMKVSPDDEFLKLCSQIQVSDDKFIRRIMRAYWGLNDSEKAAVQKLVESLCESE